jgi:hypothetical protein
MPAATPAAIPWKTLWYSERLLMKMTIMNARFLQVGSLTEILVKRLRPYVNAKHAGEEDMITPQQHL